MSLRNRLFLLIESLLCLSALWQLFNEPLLLISMVVAMILWLLLLKWDKHYRITVVLQLISVGVMIVCLLFLPSIWLMLVVILCYAFLGKGAWLNRKYQWQWQQPMLKRVQTVEPHSNGKQTVQRRPWIGNEQIGDEIFSWDDIDIVIAAGDTIIDLGQTILPARDNVIVVRKGFGRTRILVPIGIGVMLTHTAMAGRVSFEDEEYELNSECLHLKSANYELSHRRLRIITSTIIGNLEVVRI